jgi:hypothetical protein
MIARIVSIEDHIMTSAEPREIIPGLTVEEVADGDILVVNINDSSRAMVDAFVDFAVKHMQSTAHKKFDYMLADQSNSFAAFNTPYGKARLQELMKDVTEGKQSYVAMVLPKSFAMQLAQIFLRAIIREGTTTRIFFTRQEALAWLEQMHAKNADIPNVL